MKVKTIEEGEGYKVKATRRSVGTFEIVAIDWEHPNYGYFADAMIWIWSPHLDDWAPTHVVGWAEKYEKLEQFLKDYPEFSELFEDVDPLREIRKAMVKELHLTLKRNPDLRKQLIKRLRNP